MKGEKPKERPWAIVVVSLVVALALFSVVLLDSGLTGFTSYEQFLENKTYETNITLLPNQSFVLDIDQLVNVKRIEFVGYSISSKDSSILLRLDSGDVIHSTQSRLPGIGGMAINVESNEVTSGDSVVKRYENASNELEKQSLEYGNGTYDIDNDGIVGRSGGVDLYLDTDAECVLWSVVSENVQLFCQGSEECCDSYLLPSTDSVANYLVLDRTSAQGNVGNVLAKADGYAFSNQLTFDFTGTEERFERFGNECIGKCNINLNSERIEIVSDSYLYLEQIIVYYDEIIDLTEVSENDNRGRERVIELGLESKVDRGNARILVARKDGRVESRVVGRNDFDALTLDDNIVGVFEDKPVTFFGTVENHQEIHSFPSLNYGAGVRVCLVDSGVQLSALIPDINYEYISVDNGVFEDTIGHGTLVSRLITGLIPESNFIFVKVDRDGIAYDSDLITALDICAGYDVDVISLSLGSGSYDGFCTGHPVTDKISQLSADGVLVVAAAGNDGLGSVRMPACSADVLSVVRVESDGELNSGSSFVTGLSVIGAYGEFDDYSGTSFSAPAVSAGVSVLLSENVSGNEVFSRIVGSGNYIENYTYSALNVTRALEGNLTNSFWEERIIEEGEGNESSNLDFLVDISTCQTLGSANTIYNLTTNVSSTTTCMSITATNVTLNCGNNTITYGTSGGSSRRGVYITASNATVTDCRFIEGATTITGSNGILALGSSGTYLDNISISNIRGTQQYSAGRGLVRLEFVINSKISNINATVISPVNKFAMGVQVFNSNNTNVSNLWINTTGADPRGVVFQDTYTSYLYDSYFVANNNNTNNTHQPVNLIRSYYIFGSNITINNTGPGMAGIVFNDVNHTSFWNVRTNGKGSSIYPWSNTHNTNNTFYDSNLSASGGINDMKSIYFQSSTIGNFSLVNTTFIDIQYDDSTPPYLHVGWWADITVNYSNGNPIPGATVAYSAISSLSSNPSVSSSSTTLSDGKVRIPLYAYTRTTNTAIVDHNNYSINVSLSGFTTNVSSRNISTNVNLQYTLLSFYPENVTISSSSNTNTTDENLSVSYDVLTSDSLVYNTTDWRLNGASIALLNYPFNINESSTTAGALKDFSTYANNGTLGDGVAMDVPTWTSTCVVGGCYSFDGTNDYITIPSLDGTAYTNFTFSLWYKSDATTTSDDQYFYYHRETPLGDALSFAITDDSGFVDRLRTDFYVGAVRHETYGSADVVNQQWNHVAVVRNGTHFIYYVNGALDIVRTDGSSGTTVTINNGGNITDGPMIGYWQTSLEQIDGSIDEFLLLDRALSAEQIAAIYNAQNLNGSVNTLVSQETQTGENWSVAVKRSDGYSYSLPVLTDNLTIIPALACGVLSSPGTYVLSANVTATKDCFNITSDNVILDCNGYNITYATTTSGTGITGLVDTGFSNVSIRNCNIIQGSSLQESRGIWPRGGVSSRWHNLTITNVNISTFGHNQAGLNLIRVENSIFDRIKITVRADDNAGNDFAMGMSHLGSINNTFRNINITTNATTAHGIIFESGSSSNLTFENVTVTTLGSNSEGFRIQSTGLTNATIINSTFITTASALGTDSATGDNVTFINSVLDGTVSLDIFMSSTVTGNYYLLNTTTPGNSINFAGGSLAVLHRGWFLDFYVNNTASNSVSANINYTGNSAGLSLNPTPTASNIPTGLNGFYRQYPLYEWSRNTTSTYYHTNYTFNVSSPGYNDLTLQSRNFTTNTQLNFTLINDLSDCGTLSSPGAYSMITNFSSTSTCFTISSSDVSLDCGGHTISYASSSIGNGIFMENGLSNVNITNCALYQAGTPGSSWDNSGIKVNGTESVRSNRIRIANSSFSTQGTHQAIYMYFTENSTIENTVLTSSGTSIYTRGFYFNAIGAVFETSAMRNITIRNATFTGPDGEFIGLRYVFDSLFEDIVINATDSASESFYFMNSEDNIANRVNITVAGYGGSGIRLRGTNTVRNAKIWYNNGSTALDFEGAGSNPSGSLIEDSEFIYLGGTGTPYSAYFSSVYSSVNIYFVNVTFNDSQVGWTAGTEPNRIYVGWRIGAYVNDTDGNPVDEASLAWDSVGPEESLNPNPSGSNITGLDGWYRGGELYEYRRNATAFNYFQNYSILASKLNYSDSEIKYVNMSGNQEVFLTIEAIETNLSVANVSLIPNGNKFDVTYETYGKINPANTTDWRIDGTSVTVLNMPFNANVTSIAAGQVFDLSSYSNNGTLGNGISGNSPTWNESCVVGGCYNFNGSQHIRIPYDTEFAITTNITVEAWIYPTAAGQSSASNIIAKPRSSNNGHQLYALRFDSSRIPSFRFSYGASSVSTLLATNAIPLNQWTHIVGTYDGTTSRIYVNGVQNNTLSLSTSINTDATTDVSIGNDYLWSDNRHFVGLIDEPKIYNRVLSANQILENYNSGLANESIDSWYASDANNGQELSVRVYSTDTILYTSADSNGYELVNACGTFSTPGSYALTGNLSTTGSCFFITSSDVSLDCGSNTITYDTGNNGFRYGVFIDPGLNNITINNCKITTSSSSSSSSHVIFASGTSGSKISNLTISNSALTSTHASNTARGMFLEWVDDLIVSNVNTSTAGSFGHGLDLVNIQRARVNDSNFTTTGASAAGLFHGTNTSHGISYRIRSTTAGSGAAGIYFYENPTNNTVYDSILSTPSNLGVRLLDNTISISNYLINVSGISYTWATSTSSNVYVGWRNKVYVNDTLSDPVIALVNYSTGTAGSPTSTGSISTNSSGLLDLILYEYLRSNSGFTYYTNYTFNISATGYNDLELQSRNFTTNTQLNFTISSVPEVSNVLIQSSNSGNTSSENLSVTFDVSGAGDILNTTDWRLNGTSIAVINMPFNVNVSTTTSGAVRDLSSFGNNGTLAERGTGYIAPTWNDSCKIGGCYNFRGSDAANADEENINLGSSSSFDTDKFTFSFWINPTSITSTKRDNMILGRENWNTQGFRAALDADTGVEWWTTESGGTFDLKSGSPLTQGIWHHVVLRYNGTHGSIFVNGTLANTSAGTYVIPVGDTLVINGGIGGTAGSNSSIDEFIFFNKSLSNEQIQEIYNLQNAGQAIETILSQETVIGENWSVAVTSSNLNSYSDSVLSDNLTIIPALACGVLSSPGTYVMDSNLSSTGTCITINVSDVSLDCGGNTINYSTSSEGYGIVIWSQSATINNVNISNCNIVKDSDDGASTSWRPGIVGWGRSTAPAGNLGDEGGTIYNVSNVLIDNTYVNTVGNYTTAIHSLRTANWSIKNSNFTTNSDQSSAITLSRSNTGIMENLRMNTSGLSSSGITSLLESPYWTIDNITISTEGTFERGIQATSSPSWNITNATISSLGASTRGILLDTGSENWYVFDSSVDGTSYDILLDMGTSTMDFYAINTTYSNVFFQDSLAGNLHRGWYIDYYVNDTSGSPIIATLNYTDSGISSSINPNSTFSGLVTGGDGFYRRALMYEYSQNQTARYYHTNYSFNVSNTSYNALELASRNFTTNTRLNFTLSSGLSCGIISSPGSYTVSENLNSAGTCITINVSDVSLDCQGNTINYSTSTEGYGILLWSQSAAISNINISNCNIVKSTTTGSASSRRPAIFGWGRSATPSAGIGDSGGTIYGVSDVLLSNINISTSGEDNAGIYALRSSDWNVLNANVTTLGQYSSGIQLIYSDRFNFTDGYVNTGTGSDTGSSGVYSVLSSSNVTFDNVSIRTENGIGHGFYVENGFNWSISNSLVDTRGSDAVGIYVNSASNNWSLTNINVSTYNAIGIRSTNSLYGIVSGASLFGGGFDAPGIRLDTGSNLWTVNNVNITTNNSYAHGIAGYSTDNIILNNFNVSTTGLQSLGIYSTASDYWIIDAMNAVTTNTNSYGINPTSSHNWSISNTNFSTSGSAAHGFYADSGINFTLNNVRSNPRGANAFSIFGYNATYINIQNSYLNSTGTTGYGIFGSTESDNWKIYSTNISTNSTEGVGIRAYLSDNWIVNNTRINTLAASAHGLYFWQAHNAIVYNTTLSVAGTQDIRMRLEDASKNLTIINTTFDKTSVLFDNTVAGTLIVGYYIDLYVNNTAGSPIVATLNYTDSGTASSLNPNSTLSGLVTGGDGLYRRALMYEYSQNQTARYYHTNYTFNVSASGYADLTLQSRNFTTNTQLNFTLLTFPPIVDNVTLVSSAGGNSTIEDLSVNYNVSDVDSALVYNTTDWRLNGTSIARLNAPMNVNISSIAADQIKDFTTFENNGTLGAGVSGYVPQFNDTCIVGGCYYFDGVDDVISFGDPADGSLDFGTNSFSYGLWVYPTANVNAWDTPLYKGGNTATAAGYDIELGTGSWSAGLSDGTSAIWANYAPGGPLNQWSFVFAVVNRETNNFSLYINGTYAASADISSIGSVSNSRNLTIGRHNTLTDLYRGYIDEVQVYDRVLSPQQIKAIYDHQLAGQSIDTLVSAETDVNDNWTVAVTSSDLEQYSDTVLSNGLLVGDLQCGVIDKPGSYVLGGNVTSTGTCITINVSDVSLDCKGYTINYSTSEQGVGILVWGQGGNVNNVNISSCNIIKDSDVDVSNSRPAIAGYGFNNSPITSDFANSGDVNYGTTNIIVNNTNITTKGNYSRGFLGVRAADWTFEGVIINTTSYRSDGIYFISSGQPSYISNTQVFTSGTTAHGIYGIDSLAHTIVNTSVTTSNTGAYAIYPYLNSQWSVRDSSISSILSDDVYLRLGNTARRVSFINTTFNSSSIGYYDANAGYLDVGYWVDAYTRDIDFNPLTDVNVSWTDAGVLVTNPSVNGSQLTNSSGYTARFPIYTFSENQTGRYYHNNYTFTGAKTNYITASASQNITNNTNIILTLLEPGEIATYSRLYPSHNADYTGTATQTRNLNRTQDGTANFYYTNTALGNGVITLFNAAAFDFDSGIIESGSTINFTGWWETGSGTTAYATYILYKNVSGTLTTICAAGDNSTGGTTISPSSTGYFNATCTTSSTIDLSDADSLVYQVIAEAVTTGGPTTRFFYYRYDSSIRNSSVAYPTTAYFFVNGTTDKTSYGSTETPYLSGKLFLDGGTGVNGATVNIKVYNTTGLSSNINVTTNASGNYETTFPLADDGGIWEAVLTGFYSGGTAHNITSFEVIYIPDIDPPYWTNNITNASTTYPMINDNVQMNLTLNDDVNLNSYIFSWNGTGSWTNDSRQLISGTQHNVSVAKTTTLAKGSSVGWKVYFNDSSSKTNTSNTFSFLVRNTPPVLSSVAANLTHARQNANILITTSGASDVDSDTLRLQCGTTEGAIDLCNGTYGSPQRTCSFQSPWSDNTVHTVYCRVNDATNVSTPDRTTIITADNTNPVVTVVYPTATTYGTTTHTLNYTYTETNCNVVWWGNGTVNSSTQGCGLNWTGLTAYEGSNTWTVYMSDIAGNLGSGSVTFTVDTQPPILTVISPLNNTYNNSASVVFNVSSNKQVSWCGLSVGGGANITMTKNGASTGASYINSSMVDSPYSWVVYCNDTVGNMGSTGIYNFTKDTVLPWLNITYPQNISYNSASHSLNYSFVELNCDAVWWGNGTLNSSTQACGLNWTGLTAQEGGNNWTVWMRDLAGNVNKSSVLFTVDTELPIITIIRPTNNSYNNSNSVTFNISSNKQISWCGLSVNSGANITMTLNGTATGASYINSSMPQGQYSFKVYCNDTVQSVGNVGVSALYNFTIDTTLPIVNIVYPLNTSYNTTSLNINYTYTETNCDVVWWGNGTVNSSTQACGLNWSGRTAFEGFNNWTVWMRDLAGNVNKSSVVFSIDTQPPILTVISPLNNTYINSASVVFNVSSNKQVSWCGLSVGGGANITMTKNSTSTGAYYTNSSMVDSPYSWVVYCNDTVGNMGSTGIYNFTKDTTLPWLNVTYPLNTSYNTVTHNLNYSFVELNCDAVWWGNGTLNSSTQACGLNWTGLTAQEGGNNWTVWMRDLAGNLNKSSRLFTVDTAFPIITVLSPVNNTYINSSNITFNISANKQLSWCGLSVNSTANISMALNGTATGASYVNSSMSDSHYIFNVYCNDTVGNMGSSGIHNFTVDTTAPTTNASALLDNGSAYTFGNLTLSSYVNVTLTCNDGSGSGCYITQYCLDLTNTCNPNITYSSVLKISTPGTSYIRFKSNDTLNNSEITNNRTIVMTDVPVVTLTNPGTPWVVNSNPYLECSVTNNGELSNLSLYTNRTGSWTILNSTSATGSEFVMQFETNSFTVGSYAWNCQACNSAGFCTFALSNNTITADLTAPQVQFVSITPANDSTINQVYAVINVTSSDSNSPSTFLDWNYTLVTWFSIDDFNSTHIFDRSTYKNNGTRLGSPIIIEGLYGKGLRLNGTNYITINNPLGSGE